MNKEQIENVKNLLQKVSAISKKYEEIAKITGENFNIFKVMNMQSDEVKLHSAFIAELLNPKGSHGQGDIFLNLFSEIFIKESDFLTEEATAEAEKYIGEINEDYTEGGRVDIIITDSNKKNIIIENKIYARDQKNQLLRYYNYDTNAYLFYLSLYGEVPSDNSIGKGSLKKEDVKLLSYSDDIINWLQVCKKETVDLPILRETITQYINIIKHLTGQTMNEKLKQEVLTEIYSNYNSAKLISDNVHIAEKEKILGFVDIVIKHLKREIPNSWIIRKGELTQRYTGITLQNKKWNSNIVINIQGQPFIYSNSTIYGIVAPKELVDREKILEFINKKESNKFRQSDSWAAYKEIFNFTNREEIKKLFCKSSHEKLLKTVCGKIISLTQIFEGYFTHENDFDIR